MRPERRCPGALRPSGVASHASARRARSASSPINTTATRSRSREYAARSMHLAGDRSSVWQERSGGEHTQTGYSGLAGMSCARRAAMSSTVDGREATS